MTPTFAIINEREVDGYTVLTVDTTKATYQGVKWRTMGDFGKRKFENFLYMSRITSQHIKIQYV